MEKIVDKDTLLSPSGSRTDPGKNGKEAEVFENNVFDGQPALSFLSTPCGLVAIGEGSIGLVERKGN